MTTSTADAVRSTSRPRVWALPARLDAPLTSYYLVLGATIALACIGLVMVLSSSSVDAIANQDSPFTEFWSQMMFAAIGVPLMYVASRVSIRSWNVGAWFLLVVALLLQVLVFSPLGVAVNGNQNWIALFGFTLQPSEVCKFALIVWSAAVLARKRPLLDQPIHVLIPVVPAAGLVLGLVLIGHDLGTSLVLMALVGTVLFIAGAPLRLFAIALGVGALLVQVMVTGSQNRMGRIGYWLSGCTNATADSAGWYDGCLQARHGMWALASGGWLGVGLGGSREKWGLLPEAHNDFIFAVIGEELGLLGTLVVLGLFAILGYGLFRIVLRSDDLFVKIATSGVLTWVLGQAVINIGAVLGLLPVVGLPLPLVSSGGSALIMTMLALGMVIGFARREAGAPEALAAHGGLVHRSLAVLPVRRDRRAR
ncbi:MAG TPA: putative lipid II flippase FtsW [Kineosporiaceae bacterium]|nr:putative lipid II flippase FtsW [Kineosporiaceae bacterium]